MTEPEYLASIEPLDPHIERHRTDRLLMLSDGIFAIVTTLAALEIQLPSGTHSLGEILQESHQSLIAYGLSFLFTALFWGNNRDLFARVARTDNVLTVLTLITLCGIAVVPAAVKVFYAPGGLEGGIKFYALLMVVCGLSSSAAWLYWAARPGICRPGIAQAERWGRALPTLFMPVLFGIIVVSNLEDMLLAIAVVAVVMVVIRRVILPRRWQKSA